VAITRKPATAKTDPVDIDALISKGGSAPKQQRESETTPVIIRLPSELLAAVDAAVAGRPIRIPRHTWILEAIHEKLSKTG